MGSLLVLSRDREPFEDRREAGRLLAGHLRGLGAAEPLVLGIPMGGLVVAGEVATGLDAALDALFALKLRFPGSPELAAGAVAEGGRVLLDEVFVERMGIGDLMEREKAERLEELDRRAESLRGARLKVPVAGRVVIVVDDGAATGLTTRAALRSVRDGNPGRLVLALPVGPEGVVEKLAGEADETVCLLCPPDFLAVSQFYRRFPQVGREEAAALLRV